MPRARSGAAQADDRHTRFAITSEDTRYFLNGASSCCGDSMSMVATDGHRLAYISVHESPVTGQVNVKVLLPRKTLNEVARLDRRRQRRRVLAG